MKYAIKARLQTRTLSNCQVQFVFYNFFINLAMSMYFVNTDCKFALSDLPKHTKFKINFKLSLNHPYCQIAVSGSF